MRQHQGLGARRVVRAWGHAEASAFSDAGVDSDGTRPPRPLPLRNPRPLRLR